jgi:4-hydroxy-tetrahydrodipicolinate synthase
MYRMSDLVRRVPQGFCLLSGDDASGMAAMFSGAHGVISVTANVAPRTMRALCDAARAGRMAEARDANDRLLGLHRHLFVEANPIPVKWALQRMGRIESGIRLPMTPLDPSRYAVVERALRRAGVLA